jgi:hypothetical protein
VKRYNRQAALLDPPRDAVDMNQILEYSFIQDFNLLRLSREDIRSKPWAQPGHRAAMARYFRIKAAQDEITRLNVEIRRLVSSIADEQSDVQNAIRSTNQTDRPLALHIEAEWSLRQAYNEEHLMQILKLAKKDGFSGIISPGCRTGRMRTDDQPQLLDQREAEEDVTEEVGELSEDDEALEIATVMEQWSTSM